MAKPSAPSVLDADRAREFLTGITFPPGRFLGLAIPSDATALLAIYTEFRAVGYVPQVPTANTPFQAGEKVTAAGSPQSRAFVSSTVAAVVRGVPPAVRGLPVAERTVLLLDEVGVLGAMGEATAGKPWEGLFVAPLDRLPAGHAARKFVRTPLALREGPHLALGRWTIGDPSTEPVWLDPAAVGALTAEAEQARQMHERAIADRVATEERQRQQRWREMPGATERRVAELEAELAKLKAQVVPQAAGV